MNKFEKEWWVNAPIEELLNAYAEECEASKKELGLTVSHAEASGNLMIMLGARRAIYIMTNAIVEGRHELREKATRVIEVDDKEN